MNVESSPEPAQPERQRQHAGGWQGFLRWLGIGADDETSQQGENASVTYQEDSASEASSNGHEQVRTIADEVPEFLELGPQRPGGNPNFLAPQVDGPLLEDKDYQRALKALGDMELPSETIAKRFQR